MSADQPTRRALLAGSTLALASVAGPPSPAASPPAGTPSPGTDDALSALDFGALGDGQHHPLSERYKTLADARRIYPFATSLDQTFDWAGVQAAVNAVEGRRNRRVRVPAGRYRLSDSIRLPNVIDFFGDGPGLTVFDNTMAPLLRPQLVNAAPSFVSVAIRAMSLHGGTHALKISVPAGEVAWVTLEEVSCVLQTDKNIECDRLLQSSEFRNCGFSQSPYGVYVGARTTNAVVFRNCTFEQHSRTHLHLNGAEGVSVCGGKFEGGGALPDQGGSGERVTLYLEDAGAVNFDGVYFESTHEILLREVRSRGGVTFTGCHFTGADVGKGPIPFRFVSDGVVGFGANDWYMPSDGPARFLVTGYNAQKLAATGGGVEVLALSPRQQRAATAARVVPPSGVLSFVTIAAVGVLPAVGALLLTGELVVHGSVQGVAGNMALLSRRYHLRIAATKDGGIAGRVEPASTLDDAGIDLEFRLRRAAADSAVVEGILRGGGSATLQWSLDTLALPGAGGARLEADIPPVA